MKELSDVIMSKSQQVEALEKTVAQMEDKIRSLEIRGEESGTTGWQVDK